MSLFSKRSQPTGRTYEPAPSDAKTPAQWRNWERGRGCAICGKKGCDRFNHNSVAFCTGCGSAYCNGDACPGRRKK
jgi:hypothetical protein